MFHRLPLIKELRGCSFANYTEAIRELLTALLFAFLPVLLALLFSVLAAKGNGAEAVLADFLSSGEAMLVSSGLVGPLVYVLTKKYGDLPKSLTIQFPQGWFFVTAVLGVCVVASAVFGLQRGVVAGMPSPAQPSSDLTAMSTTSLVVLASSVALLFLVTVLKNRLEGGAPAEMRADQSDFLDQWKRG